MMRLDQPVVYFFPGLHFCLCIVATFWPSLWGLLLVFDFPVSAVVVALAYQLVRFNPPTIFFILGTLWWYAISWIALSFFDPQHKLRG